MSKANRETELRRGEALLQEWQLSPEASVDVLQSLTGRDPAADLAIAARLGSHTAAASVDLLLALEAASTDKLVRKEVRRSLYRLEQRGVSVPHAPPTLPAASVVAAPALEGYLSPIDGRGDQLVWLIKPRPGGIAHLFAVINDPDGLREVNLFETTRKALRESRQELLQRHELRLIEADWHYCDFLIDRAFGWATEKKQPVSGDYRGLRAQLIKQPATTDMPALIFAHLDADTVRRDAEALRTSDGLLEEKELRTWFFDQEALQPYLSEMQRIKESPLLLNPAQQQERVRLVIEQAIEELFGGERRDSWVRRLEEMAYFFHATNRVEAAKRAVAVALALATSDRGGRDIAMCETLVRASLAAFMQMEEQRQEEAARSSLVVTPQQALREAQRRR